MNIHPCPIKGCPRANLPREILMCRKHWYMVSRETQSEVYRVWNCLENKTLPIKQYLLIRERAIQEVEIAITKQPMLPFEV